MQLISVNIYWIFKAPPSRHHQYKISNTQKFFKKTNKGLPTLAWLLYESMNIIIIELHAPTSSTQKLKLMGRGGQFTYIPTLPPHVEAPSGLRRGIGASKNYFI